MTTPNLIQPTSVTVSPLDRVNTRYNSKTRAPIKMLKRETSVQFEAQVQFNALSRAQAAPAGLVRETSGYLIARATDLTKISYVPETGDKLITVGSKTGLDLYITMIQDTAYYDGSPTLTLMEFNDRKPSRGT